MYALYIYMHTQTHTPLQKNAPNICITNIEIKNQNITGTHKPNSHSTSPNHHSYFYDNHFLAIIYCSTAIQLPLNNIIPNFMDWLDLCLVSILKHSSCEVYPCCSVKQQFIDFLCRLE